MSKETFHSKLSWWSDNCRLICQNRSICSMLRDFLTFCFEIRSGRARGLLSWVKTNHVIYLRKESKRQQKRQKWVMIDWNQPCENWHERQRRRDETMTFSFSRMTWVCQLKKLVFTALFEHMRVTNVIKSCTFLSDASKPIDRREQHWLATFTEPEVIFSTLCGWSSSFQPL